MRSEVGVASSGNFGDFVIFCLTGGGGSEKLGSRCVFRPLSKVDNPWLYTTRRHYPSFYGTRGVDIGKRAYGGEQKSGRMLTDE